MNVLSHNRTKRVIKRYKRDLALQESRYQELFQSRLKIKQEKNKKIAELNSAIKEIELSADSVYEQQTKELDRLVDRMKSTDLHITALEMTVVKAEVEAELDGDFFDPKAPEDLGYQDGKTL